MNDIERGIEELEKLSRYAKILKNPDEFFHHMQGHITELSFVLSAFGISEISKSIKETLEKQLNGGWIPVSERLPKAFEYVLVSTKQSGRTIAHTMPNQNKYYDLHSHLVEDVIAWRPLPEPWKEDNSEQ